MCKTSTMLRENKDLKQMERYTVYGVEEFSVINSSSNWLIDSMQFQWTIFFSVENGKLIVKYV